MRIHYTKHLDKKNQPLNWKISDKNARPKEKLKYEKSSHSPKKSAMELH